MNHFGDGFSGGFVTEKEFLNAEYNDADIFEAEDELDLEKTSVVVVVHQNGPKKTINLRSGPKQVVQAPKKKAAIPAEIVPAKQTVDLVPEKRQVAEKSKRTLEVEEVNNSVQNFSLEN